MCIDRTFDNLNEDPIQIRPEIDKIIHTLLQNSYLKSKYLIFNKNDVINEALHQWIQDKRSEINIHSFSFRKEFSDEEQHVLNVFIEHQINFDMGLTISDILEFIKDLDKKKIIKILKKFVANDLIQCNVHQGNEYYYAPYP